MHRFRKNIWFVIIINIFFLAAGCKARETFVDEPPTVTPSISKQVRMVDSGPVQGGTLTLPVTTVDNLDPYKATDRYVHLVSGFIFESLFVQTGEGETSPWLVQSWENQEYTLWTFHLKKDVYFHHGPTLSAYDVKYSLEVLGSSGSPFYNTEICNNIQQVNVVNSLQFEIQLKEPDPLLDQKLTFPILCQTMQNSSSYVSGTGPYRYDSMDESQLTLRRFDKWWPETKAYIDTIVFKVYPEAQILDAFQNNEIDVGFVKNVDFSKYQYRGDINYQVYPDNKGNFIYVNPDSLFGQANRQDALFRYISSRLYDMNLGQVQYFDEYSESPLDVEDFRQVLIDTGLFWNEAQSSFFRSGSPLSPISIVVPKQDIQKLHTANFLVNILQDAGIKAQIQTVATQDVKRIIRSGSYDLTPMTEEIKPWESLTETLQRMQAELGYGAENSYILPLYRNQQAILFKNHIRGKKKAFYWNPYQGFASWYFPLTVESSLDD